MIGLHASLILEHKCPQLLEAPLTLVNLLMGNLFTVANLKIWDSSGHFES